MTSLAEILLALFLMTNLLLAGTGRLRQAIRLVAVQGWFVGILPVVLWNWTAEGSPEMRVWAVAAVNTVVKGFVLPALLLYATRKVNAKGELEPLVSFKLSQAIVFAFVVASFVIGKIGRAHV